MPGLSVEAGQIEVVPAAADHRRAAAMLAALAGVTGAMFRTVLAVVTEFGTMLAVFPVLAVVAARQAEAEAPSEAFKAEAVAVTLDVAAAGMRFAVAFSVPAAMTFGAAAAMTFGTAAAVTLGAAAAVALGAAAAIALAAAATFGAAAAATTGAAATAAATFAAAFTAAAFAVIRVGRLDEGMAARHDERDGRHGDAERQKARRADDAKPPRDCGRRDGGRRDDEPELHVENLLRRASAVRRVGAGLWYRKHRPRPVLPSACEKSFRADREPAVSARSGNQIR
jgi:hypothetical protein